MFGHQSDIGGRVAGSMPIGARSIFEEGVRIPPVKIWRKGKYQKDPVELIMAPTRSPEWCRADLNALIAACRALRAASPRCASASATTCFASATDELLARYHRAMKALIAGAIGDEPVSFEDYLCDDGLGFGPDRIKCSMWREKGKVVLDFEGTDPQSIGSINFHLNENMMQMFFGIYMIMVFDPQILFNDGYHDLIDVRIPEGSLLKPRSRAARMRSAASSTSSAACSARRRRNSSARPGSRLRRTCSIRVVMARADGSSSSRPASAALPAGRWATDPTGIRSGPTSPRCPTSSSNAVSR
jgi:N-methylhydantoinase B